MIDKDIALGASLQMLVMAVENLRTWYSDDEIRRAFELTISEADMYASRKKLMETPDLRSYGPKGVDYGHGELDRAERDYQNKIDDERSNADSDDVDSDDEDEDEMTEDDMHSSMWQPGE